MTDRSHRRILSIQSQVVVGYVGNKLTSFPMQTLGIEVDPLSCVQLPHHNGYTRFDDRPKHEFMHWTPQVMNMYFASLREKRLDRSYSLVISGYLSVPQCIPDLCARISDILAYGSSLYVLDPVLGDGDRMYVPHEMIALYQEFLVRIASVMTPNQFEIQLLTGIQVSDFQSADAACTKLARMSSKPTLVVITSMDVDGQLVLFLRTPSGVTQYITFPRFRNLFVGTGDLFVSLLSASLHMNPAEFEDLDFAALIARVIWVIQKILARTLAEYSLVEPAGPVDNTRALASDLMRRELRVIQSRNDILCLPNISDSELVEAMITIHLIQS